MTDHRLSDGTVVRTGPHWSITRLPCGATIRARPNENSPASAQALGYGHDVATMTGERDLIHAQLCDALCLPSHSLRMAAGLDHDARLAELEEAMVCAASRLLNAVRAG